MSVAERWAAVRAGIAAAARAAGRSPNDVQLVAVSKGHGPDAIAAAYAAGQRAFGESYAQELQAKREALDATCPGIQWHFIGRVQRNKAAVLARTDLVHGVASVDHAKALGAKRPGMPVLLQVNVAEEATKSGFSIEQLRAEARVLLEACDVAVLGLMTIPPDDEAPRRWFAVLRALRDELQAAHGRPLPVLSMGMSGDYEEAVAEGATLVRIGTAIFGARPG